MTAASPSLLEVQRQFLKAIVGGQPDALAAHVLADAPGAQGRVSIYRHTSITTRVNALKLTFPAVCKLVGAEFFEGAAHVFVEGQPPNSAWLDEYGAGFASFIAQFPPAAPVSYLSDVAALEWAISRALHAPEATAIDPAELASIAAARYESLYLVAHPALGLVRTHSPADAIWHAVLADDDAALASIDLSDEPLYLLVERRIPDPGQLHNATVHIQRLGETAWRLTAALCGGRSLGSALHESASAEPQTSAVLAEHLAAGRFIAFRLGDAADD
jgi:putative DNA-binding protein